MAQRLAAFAFVFALVAGYFLFEGMTLDTNVGDVANLQLMHVQAMQIGLGVGSAVIAAMFAIGAAIVSSRG